MTHPVEPGREAEILAITAALARLWLEVPEWRFGQLVERLGELAAYQTEDIDWLAMLTTEGRPVFVGDLFLPEPERWWLRGDLWLWRSMCEQFADTRLPDSIEKLNRLIEESFKAIVGVHPFDPAAPETVFASSLAHGGMSSGTVYLPKWRDRFIPLLRSRAMLGRDGETAIFAPRLDDNPPPAAY